MCLASWVKAIITEADNDQQNQLLLDIGLLFLLPVIELAMFVLRRQDNRPYVDEDSLPPVLPKQLVNTQPRDFLCMVSKHSFQLDSHYSDVVDDYVDLIANEQKDLIMQYRADPLLKQAIDSYPDSKGASSFTSISLLQPHVLITGHGPRSWSGWNKTRYAILLTLPS